MEPTIVIVGPTASGKSALAMKIAQMYGGEIICADSRTVYRQLDIGTAKPSREDQKRIPHHLIDIIDPDESFSAAEFKVRALEAINQITARRSLPIIVGGTGLYVDALLYDYEFGTKSDPILRDKLEQMTIEELSGMCSNKNIEIPENNLNKRHLIRAIERNGVPLKKHPLRSNTMLLGINVDKNTLKQRIRNRAKTLFENGMVDEAIEMLARYGSHREGMKGNIYRLIPRLIDGTVTRAQAYELFIRSDISLAKRQMTWFNRNRDITWIDSDDDAFTSIEHFLHHKKSQKFATIQGSKEREK